MSAAGIRESRNSFCDLVAPICFREDCTALTFKVILLSGGQFKHVSLSPKFFLHDQNNGSLSCSYFLFRFLVDVVILHYFLVMGTALFNSHRLRQIPWLVHVAATAHGDVIGQKL